METRTSRRADAFLLAAEAKFKLLLAELNWKKEDLFKVSLVLIYLAYCYDLLPGS